MLDTINVNKGLVTDIYKGGEKIWEMPQIRITVSSIYVGAKVIDGTTMPGDVELTLRINNKEIQTKRSDFRGSFSFYLDTPLAEDDFIDIRGKAKKGYRSGRTFLAAY